MSGILGRYEREGLLEILIGQVTDLANRSPDGLDLAISCAHEVIGEYVDGSNNWGKQMFFATLGEQLYLDSKIFGRVSSGFTYSLRALSDGYVLTRMELEFLLGMRTCIEYKHPRKYLALAAA